MSSLYLWVKALHIFGVVLFLGNIMVTAWWKNAADRTRQPQIIAFAQQQVLLTDKLFTIGGSVIIATTGAFNVWLQGLSYTTKWLMHGVGFFAVSGLVWLVVLVPTQMKQASLTKTFSTSNDMPAEYWRLSRKWNFFGLIAVLSPVAAIYWMVVKSI